MLLVQSTRRYIEQTLSASGFDSVVCGVCESCVVLCDLFGLGARCYREGVRILGGVVWYACGMHACLWVVLVCVCCVMGILCVFDAVANCMGM